MMAELIDRKRLKAETREMLATARVSPKGMAALYLGLGLLPLKFFRNVKSIRLPALIFHFIFCRFILIHFFFFLCPFFQFCHINPPCRLWRLK